MTLRALSHDWPQSTPHHRFFQPPTWHSPLHTRLHQSLYCTSQRTSATGGCPLTLHLQCWERRLIISCSHCIMISTIKSNNKNLGCTWFKVWSWLFLTHVFFILNITYVVWYVVRCRCGWQYIIFKIYKFLRNF